MDENIFKLSIAAISSFMGYCLVLIKRTTHRFDRYDTKLGQHDNQLAVLEIEIKHIADKMDDIVDLGKRIEVSNRTIIKALARKCKDK